mmetsp:Transcript_5585/g.7074  ORF Transcript_5585/g.7074 Transcript_5585/m.7074 type:complete len:158 (-) Transcript_5585:372-845(-)
MGGEEALIAPSVGTIAIIGSILETFMKNPKIRKQCLPEGKFTYPYTPWEHKSEMLYRAHRAQENMKEWSFMGIPLLFMFSTFAKRLPVVGEYEPIVTLVCGLAIAHYNRKYFEGYVESADGRIPPFKGRTNVLKFLLFGAVGSITYILAENVFGWSK